MRTRSWVAVLVLTGLSAGRPDAAEAIPYFARKYDVTCQTCHVSPPKLNAFGEAFRERGYRMPSGFEARRTVPFAIWASGRSDALHDENEVSDAVRAYMNKLEVISGGSAGVPWLSYFVEWRPVSLETRTRDGRVGLRDRSGRFEDIFLTAAADQLDVTAGQFRQINQVDVSLRLGLSEPLVLSASLQGSDAGLMRDADGRLSAADGRRLSLRGFSPAGRAPAVRVGWSEPIWNGWSWKTSATLPVPGEFSIPLTREARVEASNEIEIDPKGVFIESFVRRGLTSFGGHLFYDHADRFLAHAVTTGNQGFVHWTGITGLAKTGDVLRGRWSVEGEYVPSYFFGVGGRLEDRAGDGAEAAFVPYVNAHFPGTKYTLRFTAEHRFQEGRNATLFEFATIF
ncbi:MAG: hypothetical protein H0X65_15015 [Gemmatimonadetes bacterium]|jgi:hypothetical protein|nr:hypothetical protein [Gemmatimonadota bacterium]